MKIDTAFKTLSDCAARGDRCPMNDVIPSSAFGTLARAGKIRIRIFEKNWRVVDILVGPQAGKSTADAPGRRLGQKPYKVIDTSSPARRGDIPQEQRAAPWKPGDPRPLRRA